MYASKSTQACYAWQAHIIDPEKKIKLGDLGDNQTITVAESSFFSSRKG